jgi:hypothetical protein
VKTIYAFVAILFGVVGSAWAADSDSAATVHPVYSNVVLWAVGFEREDQQKIEYSVLETFEKKDLQATAMVDLVPDDRRYARTEIRQMMEQAGTSVVFEVVDAGEYGMKVTTQRHTESIIRAGSGTDAGLGPNMGGGGLPVMMGMGGDNTRYKPTRWFTAYITNITTGEQIWTDNLKVNANEGSDLRVFAGKAFRKAAKTTIKDGYFVAGEPGD